MLLFFVFDGRRALLSRSLFSRVSKDFRPDHQNVKFRMEEPTVEFWMDPNVGNFVTRTKGQYWSYICIRTHACTTRDSVSYGRLSIRTTKKGPIGTKVVRPSRTNGNRNGLLRERHPLQVVVRSILFLMKKTKKYTSTSVLQSSKIVVPYYCSQKLDCVHCAFPSFAERPS